MPLSSTLVQRPVITVDTGKNEASLVKHSALVLMAHIIQHARKSGSLQWTLRADTPLESRHIRYGGFLIAARSPGAKVSHHSRGDSLGCIEPRVRDPHPRDKHLVGTPPARRNGARNNVPIGIPGGSVALSGRRCADSPRQSAVQLYWACKHSISIIDCFILKWR